MRTALAMTAAVVALGVGCSSTAAGPSPATAEGGASSPAPSTRVQGEYVVTLAPGADVQAIEVVYGALGLRRVQDLGGGLYLVSVGEDPGPERMEALRANDPRIRAVQPNLVYRGQKL